LGQRALEIGRSAIQDRINYRSHHAEKGNCEQRPRQRLIRYAYINGLPGFVTREPDGLLQTTALLVEQSTLRAIYVMRNPNKLRHLEVPLN